MSTTRDTGTTSGLQGRVHVLIAMVLSALLISACGSSSDDIPTLPPEEPPPEEPTDTGGILNRDNAGGITDAEWPEINVRSDEPKQIRFSWTEVEGADHYRLYKNADGSSGYQQVGGNLSEPMAEDTIAVHQHRWHDARYQVEACMDPECSESESSAEQVTTSVMLDAIGYFKASNTGEFDWFGWSLALSGDGRTLAVGAPREASMARGVDGDQEDNSVFGAGAVYVFTLSDGQWQQEAYLKASNTKEPDSNVPSDIFEVDERNERFGASLSLSDDGNVLAVGASRENSGGSGVNPSERNNLRGPETGAVYVFRRSDGAWAETDFLKASNPTPAEEEDQEEEVEDPSEEPVTEEPIADEQEQEQEQFQIPGNIGDRFGTHVVLSGDGRTLAVSAPNEASASTSINGDQSDNSQPGIGAVYVFHDDDDNGWTQQAYVKPSIIWVTLVQGQRQRTPIQFGASLALSRDGNTLAVGAPQDPSGLRGVNPSPDDNPSSNPGVGAVFTFSRDGSSWSHDAYIKPMHTVTNAGALRQGIGFLNFGTSVALSADGNRLAVGLPQDLNASTGPEANPDDYDFGVGSSLAFNSGAVQLYERSDGQWSGAAFLKPSNTHASMRFGRRVAFSEDGNTLAVTALRESSAETGINGDGTDRSMPRAGAAYLFSLTDGQWGEQSYIKSPKTRAFQSFGTSLSLSDDAATLVIGAPREEGGDTGINGNRLDNSKEGSGAVFMY